MYVHTICNCDLKTQYKISKYNANLTDHPYILGYHS